MRENKEFASDVRRPVSGVLNSYAKLNLFLEVIGKRPDGYHNIETVFHEIDFYDKVSIEILPKKESSEIFLECNNLNIPSCDNLAYKACFLFLSKFNIKDSIKIKIQKNIPAGAGLGGGSSNAACVLKILAELYELEDKKEELFEIALFLGADVPFFLTGGTAVGKGIGEKLEFLKLNKEFFFVLVFPDISICTKNVYQTLKFDLTKRVDYNIFLCALLSGDIKEIDSFMFNRLEQSSFNLYPELEEIKHVLQKVSCCPVLMTGSGSTIFTIVTYFEEAEIISAKLKNKGFNVKIVKSLL